MKNSVLDILCLFEFEQNLTEILLANASKSLNVECNTFQVELCISVCVCAQATATSNFNEEMAFRMLLTKSQRAL